MISSSLVLGPLFKDSRGTSSRSFGVGPAEVTARWSPCARERAWARVSLAPTPCGGGFTGGLAGGPWGGRNPETSAGPLSEPRRLLPQAGATAGSPGLPRGPVRGGPDVLRAAGASSAERRECVASSTEPRPWRGVAVTGLQQSSLRGEVGLACHSLDVCRRLRSSLSLQTASEFLIT